MSMQNHWKKLEIAFEIAHQEDIKIQNIKTSYEIGK